MKPFTTWVLCVLACLMSFSAWAQNEKLPVQGNDVPAAIEEAKAPPIFNRDDRRRFRRFLRSDELREVRQDYAVWLQNTRRPDCENDPSISVEGMNGQSHRFDRDLPELNFPEGADRPIDAVWIEPYEVRICGIREPAAAQLSIHDSGQIETLWVPAGNTYLSVPQIRQYWGGLVQATISGTSGIIGCNPGGATPESALMDTRRTGTGPGFLLGWADEHAWDEDYTLRLCERDADVRIRITRDPETMAISVAQIITTVSYNGGPAYRRYERSTDPEAAERMRQRREERDPYYRDRSED